MNLSFLSLISLYVAFLAFSEVVSSSAAEEDVDVDDPFKLFDSESESDVDPEVSSEKDSDESSEAFANAYEALGGGHIMPDEEPFKSFTKPPPALFHFVSNNQSKNALLSYFLGGVTEKDAKGNFNKTQKDKMQPRLNQLTDAHVKACVNKHCASFFAYLGPAAYAGKDKEFMDALLKLFFRYPKVVANQLAAWINVMPDEILTENATQINTIISSSMETLLPAKVTHLLAKAEDCGYFDNEAKKFLLGDAKKAGAITDPLCMANLGDISKIDITGVGKSSKVFAVPADSLAKFNEPISMSIAERLNPEQVGKVAQEVDPLESPGKDLDITELNRKSVPSVTQKQILGILTSALEGNGIYNFGEAAAALKPDLFDSGISSEDYLALLKLQTGNLEKAPLPMLHTLASQYPRVCAIFTPEMVCQNKRFELTNPECFEYMTNEARSAVLQCVLKVHPQILKHLTRKQVEDFTFKATKKSDDETEPPKDYEGLGAITFLDNRPNNDEIISYLGDEPRGETPCTLIKDIDEICDLGLATGLTYKCYSAKNHGEVPEEEEEEEDPAADDEEKKAKEARKKCYARLRLLKSMEEILETTDLSTLDTETFAGYVRGGVVMSRLPVGELSKLKPEIFSVFNGRAYLDASHLHDHFTVGQVQGMPDDVMTTVPASRISNNVLHALRPEQIRRAGSEVKGDAGNLGSILTSENLGPMHPDSVAAFSAAVWEKAQPSAFAGITEAQFSKIPPESTTSWDLDRVKAMKPNVLSKLSAAQAEKIGSGVPDDKSPTLHIYLHGNVSEAAKNALKARIPPNLLPAAAKDKNAGGPSKWIWIAIGTVAGLAILGGLVYYFFFA